MIDASRVLKQQSAVYHRTDMPGNNTLDCHGIGQVYGEEDFAAGWTQVDYHRQGFRSGTK